MTKSLYGKLTPRELDVLALVPENLSQAEMADKLGISRGQVKNCLFNARHKLQTGCDNRLAVERAREDGQLK